MYPVLQLEAVPLFPGYCPPGKKETNSAKRCKHGRGKRTTERLSAQSATMRRKICPHRFRPCGLLSRHSLPAISRNGTQVPRNRFRIQSAEYSQQEVPVSFTRCSKAATALSGSRFLCTSAVPQFRSSQFWVRQHRVKDILREVFPMLLPNLDPIKDAQCCAVVPGGVVPESGRQK